MASAAELDRDILEATEIHVCRFGGDLVDDLRPDPDLLGGKGANLHEMATLGLPVPPGFIITTEICARYHCEGEQALGRIARDVESGIAHVESVAGKTFGDPRNPLLVSVRSGARVSMPGMMDTVLNLGLNSETVAGLAHASGDERFAWDSYRRFIQMYAEVVLGLDRADFDNELENRNSAKGMETDTYLQAADLKALVQIHLEVVQRLTGDPFPTDVHQQLRGAIAAVFRSWNCDRAKVYRRLNRIPDDWGTAVTVQAMVFGNMGETSATGVAFTRDPSTGERAYYGEYLINAQGEDVVAGVRTPHYLTRRSRDRAGSEALSLEEAMPQPFEALVSVFSLLENHYRDMQDVEFTIERGKLWILQTRSGKRTAKSAIKIAVDLAREGLISKQEAVTRVDPLTLDQLLHPMIDPEAARHVIATGLPASPGAASGRIVFDADAAEQLAAAGEMVILVRAETSPEDIRGMHAAQGILTARGGMTSHAAVVARGMGRPCVSGAAAIHIDMDRRVLSSGHVELNEGDLVTIDGSTGELILGAVPMVQPEMSRDFEVLTLWADRYRRMRVHANADTPADCRTALRFGAEGIGLCRTEHMFFDEDRIALVREMILAPHSEARNSALSRLLPLQREDFRQIFTIMGDLPVTIRLLDPPLHEFLPHARAEFEELSRVSELDVDWISSRAAELREANPMLGHRGCRIGISHPEIYAMQARAIFEAANAVASDTGTPPVVEIMVPLIATAPELRAVRELIDCTARAVLGPETVVSYLVGTMIELPRAALCARSIAEHADFFSFGTNDLTQTALGLSRDDAGSFLPKYMEQAMFPHDPFISVDEEGVGELIKMAVCRGRAIRPDLKLGICGEHGGDPQSIAFFEEARLDYVSASPFRIPTARLAAAQVAIAWHQREQTAHSSVALA